MIKNPNEYIVFDEETYICLVDKNGKHKAFAIIDTEDLERVRQHRWFHNPQRNREGYARTYIKGISIYLHQFILRIWEYKELSQLLLEADHKDRYGLNNRKANLHLCSHSENAYNTGRPATNTSGHKGICWDKESQKWRVRFRRKCLGRFNSKEEAIAILAWYQGET